MMSNQDNIAITPETKISDLLENYPQLEEELIRIAPVFNKLKNPILRRTITKVTSVRQAAAVGNVHLADMINTLRKSAGQGSYMEESNNYCWNNETTASALTKGNVVLQYDARNDLQEGVHPIGKVMADLNSLNSGEAYLLVTPFTPAPLIDKAKQKGYSSETIKVSENKYETYFYK